MWGRDRQRMAWREVMTPVKQVQQRAEQSRTNLRFVMYVLHGHTRLHVCAD